MRRDAITAVNPQLVPFIGNHTHTSIAAHGMLDLTSSTLEGPGPC
jgi:hypothetical protein